MVLLLPLVTVVMVVTVVLPLTMVDWVALVTPLFCVVISPLRLLLSTCDSGLSSMGAASASAGPPLPCGDPASPLNRTSSTGTQVSTTEDLMVVVDGKEEGGTVAYRKGGRDWPDRSSGVSGRADGISSDRRLAGCFRGEYGGEGCASD